MPEKLRHLKRGWLAVPKRFWRIHELLNRRALVTSPFTRNQQKEEIAMKKGSTVIRCFVVLMLIATFVACASTSKQEGTGEYVDNSVITSKIKSQLAADDFLKSFDISVETYKGSVQLSGFVDSQKAVDKAGQIARGVDGVKSVKNNLKVK
jgi:osmotically-inducible protein OsmY